jgi:SAM-dependent methyltransferase
VASIHDANARSYLKAERTLVIDAIRKFACSQAHKASILDLGAGSGRISSDLLSILEVNCRLGSATLVDPSPEMLGLCQTNLAQRLGQINNLEFVQTTADIFISTCNRTYDIILLNLVCSIAGLPMGFVKAIYGLLKPGGMLAFSDIHPLKIEASPFFKLDSDGIRYRLRLNGYTENQLFRQVIQAGFSLTRVATINEDNCSPYVLILLLEKDNE